MSLTTIDWIFIGAATLGTLGGFFSAQGMANRTYKALLHLIGVVLMLALIVWVTMYLHDHYGFLQGRTPDSILWHYLYELTNFLLSKI